MALIFLLNFVTLTQDLIFNFTKVNVSYRLYFDITISFSVYTSDM